MREAWGGWVAEMGKWDVFATLTYDPDKQPRRLYPDVARAHLTHWLREGPKLIGRPIEAAITALEYQKNGTPHFHSVMRLPGGVRRGDFVQLGGAWFKLHGYAKLELPKSQDDVCAYATKYLFKDLDRGDVHFWPLKGSLVTHQPALSPAAPTRGADRRPAAPRRDNRLQLLAEQDIRDQLVSRHG